ncbi:MAG: hypothetical protein HS100_10955 [Anaerolineales bacterium]|nr:hypothetical protein [Anaerolineales bacterium]
MRRIDKKHLPIFLILFSVILVLGTISILSAQYEESQYEEPIYKDPQIEELQYEVEQYDGMYKYSIERDYKALLRHFSEENPGRGVLDYPGNETSDYAKSYAMFLSAELLRAQREPEFHLSDMGENAGNWLLDNADIDGDGVVGWGLPVEWDAYGDGTVNPPNTIYTITTAIAINGLLDWLEMDPDAPEERIITTVDAAFEPFIDPKALTQDGLLMYSLSSNDQAYSTFNPGAYMAGQMQRFSSVHSNSAKRDQLRFVSDTIMESLLVYKQLDQNGGWYWNYSIDEHVPNDATHSIYIIEGIYQYIRYQGSLANQFDWVAINRHILLFYSPEELQFKRFPQVLNYSFPGQPRLYELGMLMYYMGKFDLKETGDALYAFSATYRLPDGTYAKLPVSEDGSENKLVVNEYMSYLLYGFSSLINRPVPENIQSLRSDWNLLLDPVALLPTDTNENILVPFSYFDVEDYNIELLFNVRLLKGELVVNNTRIALPARVLPIKILEWNKKNLVIFTRALWSNKIQVWKLDIESKYFQSIPMPDYLDEGMFRQGILFNEHIVFILFDPIAKTNYIYRIIPTNESDQSLQFDENYKQEYFINEQLGYRQQPKILMTKFQGHLIIASDSIVYDYDYSPTIEKTTLQRSTDLPNRYKLLELSSDDIGVFALYKDIEFSFDKPISRDNRPFILYDVANKKIFLDDYKGRVPYNLQVIDGQATIHFVESQEDIIKLFLLDLQNMPASGLMSAGVNNFEGEVIWTQSYYLNAMIDILSANEDYHTIDPFNPIRSQLKQRLDFEMALIDRMILEGPGLLCKTFTVDRTPTLHAVQTGKFLLLLKRYLTLPNAIEMSSYEEFRKRVINLDGHIEVFAQAESSNPWLTEGRYYLMWPKGSPFWADGVGIPYNHQNMWAAGVLYGEDLNDLPDDDLRQITYDISSQVLDLEGFRRVIPKHSHWFAKSSGYYQWYYWWGPAKEGWAEADDISVNTPSWRGDGDNIALPVYRTFDAITILIAGKHFNNFLPTGILEYFRNGIEKGELELFIIPYLEQYGKIPNIDQGLAIKNLRSASQPDMRNAVWAYRYLSYSINSPLYSVSSETNSQIPMVGTFILDVALVLLCAFLLNAILRIDRLIPWLIGLYLFVYAIVVLTIVLSSLLSLLNSKAFFLLFHWSFLVILTLIWLLRDAPDLFMPLRLLNLNPASWLPSFKPHWDIWIAGVICAFGFVFIGYSNLVLPQSIDDVLTAHLSRIGYWLQFGNLKPWQADTYQMAQVIYPFNAQAQIYWSLLFLRTDQLAGFSQWIALPIMILTIYGFCRMMKMGRKWAIMASLTVFSLPSIYLQTFSAMTDLISAVLFVSMLYLLLSGLESRRLEILGLSGLALGLSIGTKQTIIFAIPGLIIVLIYIVIIKKKAVIKYLLQWAGASFASISITGAYIYIANYYWWGSPFGPPATFQGFTNRETTLSVFDTLIRFLLNAKSLLAAIFHLDLFSWNYSVVNPSPGPVFGLLILFTFIYMGSIIRTRQKNVPAFSLFIISVFYGLTLLVVREYTTALLRYLIISYVLLIPLAFSGLSVFAEEKFKTEE